MMANGNPLKVTTFGTMNMEHQLFASSLATRMEAHITELGVEAPYPKLPKCYYAQEVKQMFSNVKIREVKEQTMLMMLELIVLGTRVIALIMILMLVCYMVKLVVSKIQGL